MPTKKSPATNKKCRDPCGSNTGCKVSNLARPQKECKMNFVDCFAAKFRPNPKAGELCRNPFESGKSILNSHFNLKLKCASGASFECTIPITAETLEMGFISFNTDFPLNYRQDAGGTPWEDYATHVLPDKERLLHNPRLQLHLNNSLLHNSNPELRKFLDRYKNDTASKDLKYDNIAKYLSNFLPLLELYSTTGDKQTFADLVKTFGGVGGDKRLESASATDCSSHSTVEDKRNCLLTKARISSFHVRDVIATKMLSADQLFYLDTYLKASGTFATVLRSDLTGNFDNTKCTEHKLQTLPGNVKNGVINLYTVFEPAYTDVAQIVGGDNDVERLKRAEKLVLNYEEEAVPNNAHHADNSIYVRQFGVKKPLTNTWGDGYDCFGVAGAGGADGF
jgi:hypothetical protein